ncbi:hypothetical protein GSI_14022 [Ganoderma sinense ZZ0214-1]|uniref:CAP-Gly domain-containing protein n=1 Tax=Ganoderma sinense ZZ0214-1 TaxID=1077348 RepID=A0A2G8RRY0_9APHY|nr:hypothetical protein GSI_14022 [Ganoderma sinense ZZ0214-1]
MASDLPPVGTRLDYSGSIGTVRYAGPVDGAQGIWLGVEWDDTNRGKHDGVKDGKRYFTCLAPNSGSFIRPAAAITYGLSFLTALTAKYIEVPYGHSSSEKVILGSSGGAIEVEAVGLNKIRNNLARLERLRQVSLDDENVSRADPPGEIHKTCAGIRGLDLSKNLFPSWDTVADIAIEMPNLRSLRLNQNRMRPPQVLRHESPAFHRLEELQLSATLTTWKEFQVLLRYMPALTTVELGYNRLRTLRPDSEPPSNYSAPALQEINLDGNELDSFVDINEAMRNLPGLRRLILTSNQFSHIHPDAPDTTDAAIGPSGHASLSPLRGLKHLALAFNRLTSWRNIDTLQRWCPELESLTLAGNPLVDDLACKNYARAFIIAKLPLLKALDGAAISSRERTDSELLYLSHIAKQHFPSDDERRAEHPQWDVLSAKHGVTDSPAAVEPSDTLSNRLINIGVHYASIAPPTTLAAPELAAFLGRCKAAATLRVLSTMSIRTLRLKLIKTLKVPKAQHAAVRLWMILPNGHFVELTEEFFGRDLAYWGIDEDTPFVMVDN